VSGAVEPTKPGLDWTFPACFSSEVRDGTHHLGVANGKSFHGKTPVYRIAAADLREIRLRGSGDVSAGNLAGALLAVSIAGSGDMRLAGRTDELTLSIAGSGDGDAAGLTAKRAQVSISGSSDATRECDRRARGARQRVGRPAVSRRAAAAAESQRVGVGAAEVTIAARPLTPGCPG
jgi:putative autotransporter adhesin-like protein